MTSAIVSRGVVLKIDGVPIAQCTNIGGVEITRRTIEVFEHDAAGGYAEFLGGIKETTELNLEFDFYSSDVGQDDLYDAVEDGAAHAFIITFPTAITATWSFNAVVTKFKVGDFLVEDVLKGSATLKITGVPTLAITASTGAATLTGIEENAGVALIFHPAYAIGTFLYVINVNTASDWVKLTVTAAAHTIKCSIDDATETTLTTGVQSGELAIGAAATVTKIEIRCYEAAKTDKAYVLYIQRP